MTATHDIFKSRGGLSQDQVALRLGISRGEVQEAEKRALRKLRKAFFQEILQKKHESLMLRIAQ